MTATAEDQSIASEVTLLLQRLVQAPSPNPPGDEGDVQRVVREYLDTIHGVNVEQFERAPSRPIIMGRLETGRPGPTIVLSGHIDTVPVGDGWTHDPFGGVIEDGNLFGRGAADMKGGVAAILVALRRLAGRCDDLAGGTLELHIVPDEEPGGELGTAVLLAEGKIKAHAAIIAEPSELAVFRAQKGNIFAAIRVTGRAAHGSMPEQGVNAITAAARLVLDIEERLAPTVRVHTHQLLGASSVNVGTIHGGRRTNMVPDECIITVDRRLMPDESADIALRELEEFVGSRGVVSLEAAGGAFDTPPEHWLVGAATDAVEQVLGQPAAIGGLIGSSDARYYAQGAGIPTIILGPGAMTQAHVADEHVPTRELPLAVQIYETLAEALLARA
jgi:acetylornithine deacetylase/succinyl-diaminopimelate desuccinylase family protein